MKSLSDLQSYYKTASQNTTTANVTWGTELINDTHRYLLQDFFNNERTVSLSTQGSAAFYLFTTASIATNATSATLNSNFVGTTGTYALVFSDSSTQQGTLTNGSTSVTWSTPLTNAVSTSITAKYCLTGSLAVGATSATLGAIWNGQGLSNIQVTFSSGDLRNVTFTNNSASITWTPGLTNVATSTIGIGGEQFYNLPADYSKMLNPTITVGNLQWGNLKPILTRQEWDRMNVFPYYADIPVYYYIFPGGDHGSSIGIWPIPPTTGNVINVTYKFRVVDLSLPDYMAGTVTATKGSSIITGSGTSFLPTVSSQVEMRWIQIPQLQSDGITNNSGDNQWYQVLNITGSTITLAQPYSGATASGKQYTLGQMPILNEDFHDLLVYRPLQIYFSSINKDIEKASQFTELYDLGMERLQKYCATDTVDVNLGRRMPSMNPNLFYYGNNN